MKKLPYKVRERLPFQSWENVLEYIPHSIWLLISERSFKFRLWNLPSRIQLFRELYGVAWTIWRGDGEKEMSSIGNRYDLCQMDTFLNNSQPRISKCNMHVNQKSFLAEKFVLGASLSLASLGCSCEQSTSGSWHDLTWLYPQMPRPSGRGNNETSQNWP